MKYISTRGEENVTFTQTVLNGLAPDGGLYLPTKYPKISAQNIKNMDKFDYLQIAEGVMWPFVKGDIEQEVFRDIIHQAYAQFDDTEITPVKKLEDDIYMLELFHGPTLAFKDVALQVLGKVMDWALTQKNTTATVIAATSGDTGPAAIAGLTGLENVKAFILFPKDKVSNIQQRQMTTTGQHNIFPVAIEGTFDDCQYLVKQMFNDTAFRQQIKATAINSISWARLIPQIVYYFYAWSRIPKKLRKKLYISVPTGNFGDIFAGYVAKQMGLPFEKLIIASNENDILTRFIQDGDYSTQDVIQTCAPSIDIQVASNFERLLFDIMARDSKRLTRTMKKFAQTGTLPALNKEEMAKVRDIFSAVSAPEEEIYVAIHEAYERYGVLIDPHTAVGLSAIYARPGMRPALCLSTAHPAKFPDAVEKATGINPPLPKHMQHILKDKEIFTTVPNDINAIQDYISQHI
jgi:threonine synthase